jgi:hypothetical protein
MPRPAILLCCLAACGSRSPAPVRLDPGPAPLAAGTYFRQLEYNTCPACPAPRAAVVLATAPTASPMSSR